MLNTGTLIKGRYEITGVIGKGGMSTVYRGRDRVTGNDLAIKAAERMRSGDGRTSVLSLAAEGRILKQLSHPLLPKIYDVIGTDEDFMIVMDYVEGSSLDKVIEEYGAMSMDDVLKLGIQICAVLQYLHTQNPPVIYRDIKPANIILQPDGGIKLIDFGTARTYKISDQTSDTILIGTEGFAAPEQFGGLGQTDSRTDIFCLGATMFNLVTNHSPYKRPFGVTPLEKWNPALKGCDLDRIIRKCTERLPENRYQSAWELREDLIDAYQHPGSKKIIPRKETEVLPEEPEEDRAVWQEQEITPESDNIDISLQSEGETVPVQPAPAVRAGNMWMILMIVGLAAGAVLLIIGLVLRNRSGTPAAVSLVTGICLIAFGIVSLLQYLKEQNGYRNRS